MTLLILWLMLLSPSSPDVNSSVTAAASCSIHVESPGKKVQLQSQYLKEIQNLRDENVLNVDEFQAEKDTILTTLRELK